MFTYGIGEQEFEIKIINAVYLQKLKDNGIWNGGPHMKLGKEREIDFHGGSDQVFIFELIILPHLNFIAQLLSSIEILLY